MSASGPPPPTAGAATAGTLPADPHAPPSVAPPAPPPAHQSAALARFAVAGLLAALDAHRAGTLATPRLGWELRARLDQLAAAGPPDRALTRLRWLAVVLERAGAHPPADRTAGLPDRTEGPGTDGRTELAGTVAAFRATLRQLTPEPAGPAGAAQPPPPLSAVVGRPWVA